MSSTALRSEWPWYRTTENAEARGKARLFIQKMQAADTLAYDHIKAAYALAKAEMKRKHKTPSHSTLIAISNEWSRRPSTGSLATNITREDGALRISEARLQGSYLRREDWDTDAKETGISLCKLQLRIDKHGCSCASDEHCFVGHHALTRWYQRNLDISEAALLNDLERLFLAYTGIVQARKEAFEVPTKGRWLGKLCSSTRHSETRTKEGMTIRVQTWQGDR
jgi:hypothetical protein